ncbi:MAG: hypothetical protein LBC63_05415, partial [Holophagales bacterium]|nr:hypothetical protein [Holophagales bacterium]
MLLCVLFLPAVLAAQVPDAPNLEQILAKHFEAMGGLDKLASVKTVRITATIPKSTGSESIVFESAPGFTCRHSKIDLGNVFVESIVVTSPKGGWRSSPFANSGKPVEYDIKERKRRWNDPSSVIFSHVGSSPFVGYKEKGLKAEYLGLGDYADGKAHKVSLEYPDDGYTLIYFLDAKSYLPAKVETKYP